MARHDLAVLAAVEGDWDTAHVDLESACLDAATNRMAALNLNSLETVLIHRQQRARRVRIVIVSALFNWPSHGGGNVHTIELAVALQHAGYDVHHLYLEHVSWDIGRVAESPFPSQAIHFTESTWNLSDLQDRVRCAVESHQPDVVLITDSWNLKPWLANAVKSWPYLLRFDAMECLCPLNNLRLLPIGDGHLVDCFRQRLTDQASCLACVRRHQGMTGSLHTQERTLSRFETVEYHALLIDSLAGAEAVLVHNPQIAEQFRPVARRTAVVPIGVGSEFFREREATNPEGPVRVLFAGRSRDPVKGFGILLAACRQLRREGLDFRLLVTGSQTDDHIEDFVEYLGWLDHSRMPEHLANADVLVAPSVAQEPFGLSVAEAMAVGRPVVASRVGGYLSTVLDECTGLLSEPGSVHDLARQLRRLIRDPQLRARLGAAARTRALLEYSWPRIIYAHYRLLLERPVACSGHVARPLLPDSLHRHP
ncbi:MAG: glycosyltransferase family 4 protein [Pirellulales bacterium]